MARIDAKYCTITLEDGAKHSVEVKLGDGDVSWTEHRDMEYMLDRGNLDTVREADQAPVDLTIDAVYEYYSQVSTAGSFSVNELAMGSAVGLTTSDTADTCAPYACTVTIEYEPICAGATKETIVFTKCRFETADFSIKDATINLQGRCNILRPTATVS